MDVEVKNNSQKANATEASALGLFQTPSTQTYGKKFSKGEFLAKELLMPEVVEHLIDLDVVMISMTEAALRDEAKKWVKSKATQPREPNYRTMIVENLGTLLGLITIAEAKDYIGHAWSVRLMVVLAFIFGGVLISSISEISRYRNEKRIWDTSSKESDPLDLFISGIRDRHTKKNKI